MGRFAQQIHPLIDSVTLAVQRTNSTTIDTVMVRDPDTVKQLT